MNLNKTMLIGYLARDPEVKVTKGGLKVAKFPVATNSCWKGENGEKKERVDFHRIVAWRKLGEVCENLLRKGSQVYIEGRLENQNWEGKDGAKRFSTEIVADNMIVLDKKGRKEKTVSEELDEIIQETDEQVEEAEVAF